MQLTLPRLCVCTLCFPPVSSGRSGFVTMESLTAERQEMVATLMAVAGIEDVDFAREFLQDNG